MAGIGVQTPLSSCRALSRVCLLVQGTAQIEAADIHRLLSYRIPLDRVPKVPRLGLPSHYRQTLRLFHFKPDPDRHYLLSRLARSQHPRIVHVEELCLPQFPNPQSNSQGETLKSIGIPASLHHRQSIFCFPRERTSTLATTAYCFFPRFPRHDQRCTRPHLPLAPSSLEYLIPLSPAPPTLASNASA